MKFSSILFRFFKIAVLSAAAVALCACGQRGPLIHPDKDKALGKSARPAKSNAAPASSVPAATSPAQAQQASSQSTPPPEANTASQTGDGKPLTSESGN